MAGNRSLAKAKDARQDEFYTRLTDIEKELRHYRRHLYVIMEQLFVLMGRSGLVP